jgi:hypothetical protein
MIPLFTLEDIQEIPSGVTLWGSLNSQLLSNADTISQLNQALSSMTSLTYLDPQDRYSSFSIHDFQINSSISGQSIFIALVEKNDLPLNLTPGTVFYLPASQSLFDSQMQKISASKS